MLALLGVSLGCLPVAGAAARTPGSLVACPGSEEAAVPASTQARSMRCLVNYARRRHGLAPLEVDESLHKVAARQAADIVACDSFSHEPCGHGFAYWMRRFGYLQGDCWRAGENIAWGVGAAATPRQIFRAWMASPGHRENILGRYADTGIALEVGTVEGHAGAHVWTEEFGSHSC